MYIKIITRRIFQGNGKGLGQKSKMASERPNALKSKASLEELRVALLCTVLDSAV